MKSFFLCFCETYFGDALHPKYPDMKNNTMLAPLPFCLSLLCLASVGMSQTLPAEMHFSTDGRILYTGNQAPAGLYDYGKLVTVHLNFSQPDYWTQLTNNYRSETNLLAAMVYDGVTYDSVGVRFRGNTSYNQVGTSQKKSFKVELDFVRPEQTISGYKNLKFNNAHEDPSFMREVLYGRLAHKYTPIAKANFIHLFINSQDWGIYPNVQQTDKTFLEEWFLSNDGARFRATVESATTGPGGPGGPGGGGPGWGDGTAGMNYLGSDTSTYQKYYTLQSSDISQPWSKLVDAFYGLSLANAANLDDTKELIDVDKALWFLAVENIFTDDDSYVMKGKMDYLLYYEPETGRTTPLEYDGNSTFQTSAATISSWSPFRNESNANYPLLNKLLNIPEVRQRYLAHYRTILQETFNPQYAHPVIDAIDAQIKGLVAADPKKLYTTTQYTNGIPALKTFISSRYNYLIANTEVAQQGPTIAAAPYYNGYGQEYAPALANEPVVVRAPVSATAGVYRVRLYYATGLAGNFEAIDMLDDGRHGDASAGDGIFGASIPGYAAGTLVRYYVEAIAGNTVHSATYLPAGAEHDVFVYTVQAAAGPNGVVINEIMASNAATAKDSHDDYDDWIELYNNNDYEVDLGGYYLSDDLTKLDKWQIATGTIIPAKGYLIFWADDEEDEGPMHTSYKLSTDGEDVVLSNAALEIVDSLTFLKQETDIGYARVPNGTGSFKMQAPTFAANNDGTASSVRDATSVPGILLYPVPVSDILNITFDDSLSGQTVQCFNALGQAIHQFTVQNSRVAWDVSHLPGGVYYLKCGSATRKFIISQ